MVNNLKKLAKIMEAFGVTHLYAKKLSPNDNSKNQVYLGSDFETLNIIPNKGVTIDGEEKGSKRDRFKAQLDFSWLDEYGKLQKAPHAQLILYPKYPEVRLSGFLQGCEGAPSRLMGNTREPNRVLFFGVTDARKIIGYVVEKDSPVAKDLLSDSRCEAVGVFRSLSRLLLKRDDPKAILLSELKRINLKGWVDSVRLNRDGTVQPCRSRNCGGYTLETEFGITPNGYSDPDFMGWEIKQFGVNDFKKYRATSPVTLMTPEPTAGIYVEKGVEEFIRRYGYPDKSGIPDRLNFGGVYKADHKVASTGLTLVVTGYNAESGKIEDSGGGIVLSGTGNVPAAVWNFSSLMEHWTRKHNRAVYVPSLCRLRPRQQYQYGSLITLGEGTDFLLFLKAIAVGMIYYDPGIKLENASSRKPTIKRRSQFRINPRALAAIYQKTDVVDLRKM